MTRVLAIPLNKYVNLTGDVKLIMGIVHHKALHEVDGKLVTIWLSHNEIVGHQSLLFARN